MSESTFTVSFKCDDGSLQDQICNLFDAIALNPEKSEPLKDRTDSDGKQRFIDSATLLIGELPGDSVIKLIQHEEFSPEAVKYKDKKGYSVLYMYASSTAGFGGWPGYSQMLAMEELLNSLGVDDIKFPLLKEAKSLGDVLEIFDEPAELKQKQTASGDRARAPKLVQESYRLAISGEIECVVELELEPSNFADKLKLVFDDGQVLEYSINMINGAMWQEQSVDYKDHTISFKTRFHMESEKSTSRYTGHIGVFSVDGAHALEVEF